MGLDAQLFAESQGQVAKLILLQQQEMPTESSALCRQHISLDLGPKVQRMSPSNIWAWMSIATLNLSP